ncbi:MAG: hypothetical protein ACK5BP_09315, partial [Planctomyces sp.]
QYSTSVSTSLGTHTRQARAVRFNNFLKPGESLLVSATLKSSGVGESEFLVSGTVTGQSAVSGRLLLLKQNLAERNPQLADNDERLKAAMRDLWAQLWVPASAAAS